MNNWIIISGCPSSGKTTLLNELSLMGYHTISQAGEDIIKQRLNLGEKLKNIRKDTRLLQYQIAELQVHRERSLKKNLTFFDCSIIDCFIFCLYYKIPFPGEFGSYLTNHYKKVFILDPLPNKKNGVRIESNRDRKEIQYLTYEIYKAFKVPIVQVPVMNINDRLKYILDYAS